MPAPAQSSSSIPSRNVPSDWGIYACAVLLVLATWAAYANSLAAPFVFDDIPSILANKSITQLWPPWVPLTPPQGGITVSGRPLVNFSLALNFAVSGREVWSYHLLNLGFHCVSGLLLFGILRRSFTNEKLAPRFAAHSLSCAFTIALLWLLHPLQTQAVTYVIQRAESLMGFFFLLTLYCFIRSNQSAKSLPWKIATWSACLLGMTCKEVMVTAPLVLFLYDRTFIAGSFGDAWRRRKNFYAALATTWIVLLYLVLAAGGDRGGTFNTGLISFWNYGLTQFEALATYLRLSVWPAPLCFEYGVPQSIRFVNAAPYMPFVLIPLGCTVWALVRRPILGFLGACFFLILAPTSIMPGVMQVIVEHRMYLPLAAILSLLGGSVFIYWGRRGVLALLLLAFAAGILTSLRNQDYQSDLRLWEDAVAKRPQSSAAQSNLGTTFDKLGRTEEALARYEESLRLKYDSAHTHYNLGVLLTKLGRLEEAKSHLSEATRIQPRLSNAHNMMATVLAKQGLTDEALASVQTALSIEPDYPDARLVLGLIHLRNGQLPEAIHEFQTTLMLQPDFSEAEMNLSLALMRQGRLDEAQPHLLQALRLAPDPAAVHFSLAIGLATAGHIDDAVSHYRKTLVLLPSHADAHLNLGILLGQAGQMTEALTHLDAATRLQPESPEAHMNFGIALAMSDRTAEAVQHYETALRLRPTYAIAHYNLGNALLALRRWSDAKQHFTEALRLNPGYQAARDMLNTLP